MKKLTQTLLATSIAASFSSAAIAGESNSFMEAMTDGKASVMLRYRIETVTQDNAFEDATASTVKARLNYTTGSFSGFSGVLEFDQVSSVLLDKDYNAAGRDGNPDYSVIADPEATDMNQAYAQYKAGGFTAKYGRQRILLDNQRFLGGVGWRQSEQTFDALSGVYKAGDLTATAIRITNRKNIFGELNDVEDNIINVKYAINPAIVLTGYAYLLDTPADDTENDTMGVSLTGKAAGFEYRAEVAQQESASYDALYSHLMASYKIGPVKLGLGQETLGSDDGTGAVGFKYGTNHAFNGWADQFLGTPAVGLVDQYLSVAGKAGGVTLAGFYHTYESDFGSTDMGSEINFVAKGKVGPVGLLFKFADYSAGDAATGKVDTQKVWLMSTLKF